MTRFVISDFHLGHENIIKYCDRPFDDVEEMNATLINNWNSVVGRDDAVLFLGDFGWWDVDSIIGYYEQLNGEMLLVRGNHDEFTPDDVPFPMVDSCTIEHDGKSFFCCHYPMEVPADANWWGLYGHHHNNFIDEFPFIDPDERRVNVSCELLDYTPIPMSRLAELVTKEGRLGTIEAVE